MGLKLISLLNHIVFNSVPFRCLVLAENGKMFEGFCKLWRLVLKKRVAERICLPLLYFVWCSVHVSFFVRVDLFSLDIEGAEYDVLKTVPWDKVNIDALLIEVIIPPHCPEFSIDGFYKAYKIINIDFSWGLFYKMFLQVKLSRRNSFRHWSFNFLYYYWRILRF